MTDYGRDRTLQEDLQHHFGEMLDQEGPFQMEQEQKEHLDRQYDRMDVDEYLGIDAEHLEGQVYEDEENGQAAYFSTWNEIGDTVFAELETDGTDTQIDGYLRDKFVQ